MKEAQQIEDAILRLCATDEPLIDTGFLCQSLGSIGIREALPVQTHTPVEQVMELLRRNKIGCVSVVNEDGKLVGIFSERDYVLKLYGVNPGEEGPVGEVMTPNPAAEKSDCTVAYALNLMSRGGYRHLPIVDDENRPVGMISIKDMADSIMSALLMRLTDVELES